MPKRIRKQTGPRAFFFTGAGLSAESGVPTFNGAKGYYSRFLKPEDIVHWRTLKEQPDVLHEFIDDMRVNLGKVEPNPAHQMIARLAADHTASLHHFTQNIDDLVERAGFDESVHIHGFLTRLRSIGNSKVFEDIGHTRYWSGDTAEAPKRGFKFRCPRSNSFYRPDIVLFGELAPLYADLNKTVRSLGVDDIAVVIGTQGAVVPIGPMLAFTPCRRVLVNPESSEYVDERNFDIVLKKTAVNAADDVEEIVRDHLKQRAE